MSLNVTVGILFVLKARLQLVMENLDITESLIYELFGFYKNVYVRKCAESMACAVTENDGHSTCHTVLECGLLIAMTSLQILFCYGFFKTLINFFKYSPNYTPCPVLVVCRSGVYNNFLWVLLPTLSGIHCYELCSVWADTWPRILEMMKLWLVILWFSIYDALHPFQCRCPSAPFYGIGCTKGGTVQHVQQVMPFSSFQVSFFHNWFDEPRHVLDVIWHLPAQRFIHICSFRDPFLCHGQEIWILLILHL